VESGIPADVRKAIRAEAERTVRRARVQTSRAAEARSTAQRILDRIGQRAWNSPEQPADAVVPMSPEPTMISGNGEPGTPREPDDVGH
jgi:hypothetical protein